MKSAELNMKKIYKWLVILTIIFFTNLSAQVASVTWPLTSNQNANTPIGNIQASAETIGSGSGSYLLSVYNPYVANGQRLWTGNQGTGWIAGLPDYTRYIQFDSSPTSGNNFTVQYISFNYSDNPLGTDFNIIKAEVWYSIDGWNSKVQLNSSPLNYLNTSVQTFSKSINVPVQNGQTFSVRIYPYTLNGGLAMTPSFATHKNVIIEGTTSPVVINNGSICGMKFDDWDGNGVKDESNGGLAGWTINLSMGAIQMTATTGADGSYCFNNLAAGTYTISETPQSGWRQTYPVSPVTQSVTLTSGQSVVNINFGNKRTLGSISGIKFNDLNGTGDQQIPAEPGLPNWTINLSGPVSLSATTDANGFYQFNNLPAGTYTITETNQSGWQQIYPSSPGSYTVVLAEGDVIISKNFANRQILGSICGMKYNDLDGNGKKDGGENGLAGWTITLSMGAVQMTATTGADGSYCFNNLQAGTYTISETQQSGWQQTYPINANNHNVTITPGLNLIGIDFGNKEILNPNCTDFENNSLNGWQANNISTSFQQNGTNNYIQTTDQAGVSTFYTSSKPFTGNWTSLFSNGCGSLCFDINFIYGGDVYNGVTPPQTLTPYIALEGAGFKASFVVNQTISVGDGWHSYCAPLSFLNSDGTLPSNSDGYWIMTLGTASDWNTLLTNVTKVRLLADPTSYQNEKIGYDNICLKNTGDCNPPTRLGSICGIKIHDKDGDGIKDSNEDGIPNWTITIASGTTTYTTTTDANGEYCFNNLPAGIYTISEEHRIGWRQVFPPNPGVHTINLLAGQNINNINFSNVEDITIRLGSICGIKFNDINGDGDQDPGESGLSNWTFQLSGAANMTAITDAGGYFCFTNLTPGDYIITELIKDGWEVTTPNSLGTYSVNLLPGQNLEGVLFGNKEKLGSLCGMKYNDLNGNGSWDSGEPGLSGWQISLSSLGYTSSGQAGGPTMNLISTIITDKDGNYCFTNVKPGSYLIGEIAQNGWTQTQPASFIYGITLTPGQNINGLNFGNKGDVSVRLGSICGIKFNDKDGDGEQDPDELGIPDWPISIGGPIDMTVVTDKNGKFCFENLLPGEYKVGEQFRSGWRQTKPSTNFYIIQLTSGQNIADIKFGNTQDDKVQLGSICGTKFNDKNRDGRQVSGELGIANWTIYLEGPMNLTAVTDDNGNFCFYGLIPGTYIVREENKTGWRQTKPSSITYTLEITNGTNFTGMDFGNTEDPTVTLGSICGMKFNDLNGDGKKQDNEPGIPNWTINLSGTMNLTITTDSKGYFCFEKLRFGSYIVSEAHKDKWIQTAPSTGVFTVELTEDRNPDDLYFGNREDVSVRLGSICGMKFNDKDGNGRKDSGEYGIPNWQINIGGPVDRSVKTDKNGEFCFVDLPPGTYLLKEEPQTNWVQTFPASPGSYTVLLSSGQSLTDYNFGNKYEPKIGCVQPPSGMVAWWPLDLSSREKRQDLAGFNNSGTMINDPLQVAGKVLGALQFDGIDDYVEVADHSELNFGTGNFSFDAWIKTDAKIGVEVLVDKRKGYNLGYSFFLNDGYLSLQLADGSGFFGYTNYASPVFVADGNWHHIAVTVTRSSNQGILFYLDGVSTQFGNPTAHPSTLDNTDNLRIGRNSSSTISDPIGTFKGILDEIELFNRALTKEEIVSIFNAGSAGKCKPSISVGSVSGVLWHDTNYNRVKDPNEVVLTKWPVLLNGQSLVQVETDDKGNFHFADLNPGDYTLSVANQNNWFNTFPNNGSYQFKLEEGQTLDALHFGFANDPCLTGVKTWSMISNIGNVRALTAVGSSVYAGGSFNAMGGVSGANKVAKWDGQSWSALGSGLNTTVHTIVEMGGDLFVGGGSSNSGLVSKWNGTSWSSLGSGMNGRVYSLVFFGGVLYAGGEFTTAGGVSANHIARWDGLSWQPVGSGFNNNVRVLKEIGGKLYAGGDFTSVNGVNANRIAIWDGTNWSTLGTGLNNSIYALNAIGQDIYVGGNFSSAGGVNAKCIAKWNGTSWSSLGLTIGGFVYAIEVIGQDLYLGGSFTTVIGGANAHFVVKWDAANSSWLNLSVGLSADQYALAIMGSDLYTGGFSRIWKYSCRVNTTSIGEEKTNDELPQKFQLSQNFPNPFNPTSTIRYNIASAGFVKISVYDILGREVRVLVNEEKNPGHYEILFDARELSSGVYFYTIRTRDYTQSKKMILLK